MKARSLFPGRKLLLSDRLLKRKGKTVSVPRRFSMKETSEVIKCTDKEDIKVLIQTCSASIHQQDARS